MKAVQVYEFGGPEVLRYEDVPDPEVGPGDALIRVTAVGVNYADVTSRIGRYRPALPWIPGNEAAGEVLTLGSDVTRVSVGDHVAWATPPAGLALRFVGTASGSDARETVAGTYAELALAPADRLIPIPDGLSDADAAATAMQGITAHYLAHGAFSVSTGDRVLIHAGAGGVGYLLTQLAKHSGATVYTTVSTPEKAAFSRLMGADEVINYAEDDFLETVMTLTNDEGVDAVYDSVGMSTFERSLDCLTPCGTLLLYGQSSGPVPPFDVSRLNTGSYFLTRPSIAHYTRSRADLLERGEAIFKAAATGELTIHVFHEYPLAEAAEAHRAIENRQTIGKILLLP